MDLYTHSSNYNLHTEQLGRSLQMRTITSHNIVDTLGNQITDQAGNPIVGQYANYYDTIRLSADGPVWELRG